ncbi:MAG: ABC transporter substrate-binding protein [Phototrophicaceae bacterium]
MKTTLRLALLVALLLGVLVFPTTAQDDLLRFEAASCEYGGSVKSLEAVDALTFRLTLCNPDPALPSKVAFSALGIHPSEYLEATGGGGPELFQNPVGTGPYMLENWDLGNELVLSRNDGYWGEAALEPTVIFRWNSEASQRLAELQAGTVDGIDNPGVSEIEIIEGDSNLALFPRAGTNVFYLGLNNAIAPMDNVNVRQAIAHAIDRQKIVDDFYPAGSLAATQFMPPVIFGFTPEVEPLAYDPEGARALLAAAEAEGVTLPIQLTISYRDVVRGYLPTPGLVAQELQAQLAEVGIEAEIVVMESGAFLDAADAGELQLHLLGWGADYPDATNFLDYHFGAGSSAQFGEKFPEIVENLTAGAQLADFDARYPYYVAANTAIRDLVPMVPIAHGGSAVAYRAEISGNPHSSPLGNEAFSVVEDPSDDNFVWMQNAEPIGLYCADETDGESLRACEQINEALLAYEVAGTAVIPSLAVEYSANEDLTEWTFTLREGVTFHDGSTLDANDVVMSYAVQWVSDHPLHVGRDGNFTYFSAFFTSFITSDQLAQ